MEATKQQTISTDLPSSGSEKPYPLTALQEAMLLRSLSSKQGGHYVAQFIMPFPKGVRVDLWQEAWSRVIPRHDVLNAYFRWRTDGVVEQFFAQNTPVSIQVRDFSGTRSDQRENVMTQFLEEDTRQEFDFTKPPLWRMAVLIWGDGSQTGVWTFHHAILDGRSRVRVLEEVSLFYEALCCGKSIELPSAESFAKFLEWRASQPPDAEQAYWRNRFSGFTSATALPSVTGQLANTDGEGLHGWEKTQLNETETSRLKEAATRHGVTLNNMVQGAWALALGRYNDVPDVTFGSTRAGRHWGGKEHSSAVGMFITTVPFRVNVQPNQPLGQWLQSLREQQVALREAEFTSVSRIRKWAGLPSGTPLWHSVCVFENRPLDEGRSTEGAIGVRIKLDTLTLAAYGGPKLTLRLGYSPNEYSQAQIRIVLGHLRAILLSLTDAPTELPLGKIGMMTKEETDVVLNFPKQNELPILRKPLVRLGNDDGEKPNASESKEKRVYILNDALQLQAIGVPGELFVGDIDPQLHPQLPTERFLPDTFCGKAGAKMFRTGHRARWLPNGKLEYIRSDFSKTFPEWNGVEMQFPHHETVVSLFRKQVQAQPDALAIKHGERRMTYGELDQRSNVVCAEFRRRGLQPEDLVAVILPASADFVVVILGILKAGGAYLPIDPTVPAKRLEFLLNDSQTRFAVTEPSILDTLHNWKGSAIELDKLLHANPAGDNELSHATLNPAGRVYVTYTSGSTGQPKGAEIEHHSLTNLVCCYHHQLKLTPKDRAAMLANVAFDASVADVWPALCIGASLVIPASKLMQDPHRLISWLAEEGVTWTLIPTGLAEILFGCEWPAQISMRFLLTGGDRLHLHPPRGLSFTVMNAYGPTENTVIATWSVLAPKNSDTQLPPIGRPLANVKTYVLDEHRQPVPVGVAGELYLGGEQVSRGYLGRPALTAERFLPDPFSARPNARMYRTGDWVRWLPDGEIEFIGRQDDQVQIRGMRVELGEIESTLLTHPAVRQVCCAPLVDRDGVAGVVAHLVTNEKNDGLSTELKAHLSAQLPAYMLPSQFIFHERLPLTTYGKVDRKALASSQPATAEQPRTEENQSGLETALARLWYSLLPAAKTAPREATFASLGGDSLLAVKLMLGVEEIINRRLELSSFMLQPTFTGLCQAVKNCLAQTEFQPVLVLRKEGKRPPLFCLYDSFGDINVYFTLVEAIGDDQPIIGIRSAGLQDMARLPDSMESAAADMVQCIRRIQPTGAPALVGYSWAGLLAFEVARQFAEKEGVSCFTALLGTAAPFRTISFPARLWNFTTTFPGWTWRLINDRQRRRQRLSRLNEMARETKATLQNSPPPMPEWASSPISHHLIGLMRKYQPRVRTPMKIDLFREGTLPAQQRHPLRHPLHPQMVGQMPDGGWAYWAKRSPQVHWVEGEHLSVLKPPAVYGLAKALRHAMDQHGKWKVNS